MKKEMKVEYNGVKASVDWLADSSKVTWELRESSEYSVLIYVLPFIVRDLNKFIFNYILKI